MMARPKPSREMRTSPPFEGDHNNNDKTRNMQQPLRLWRTPTLLTLLSDAWQCYTHNRASLHTYTTPMQAQIQALKPNMLRRKYWSATA